MVRRLSWILLSVLLCAGCTTQPGPDDDDDSADDDAGDDDTAAAITVSGVVIRDTELLASGDGIGTLCVGILYSCTDGADILGVQLDGADLTDPQNPVPFSIEIDDGVLGEGSVYYLGALFSEDPIECEGYEVSGGEMVNGECPQISFTGASVEGIEIVLTTKIAWPA